MHTYASFVSVGDNTLTHGQVGSAPWHTLDVTFDRSFSRTRSRAYVPSSSNSIYSTSGSARKCSTHTYVSIYTYTYVLVH